MTTRNEMWEALGADVDLLIIGGGVNGAGIARDAARRGLSVALLEMKDLAYGTSSRSSKLVHGGLRYLEQLEFSLVFESVSERRILMDIAPHLVNPLGFLFPVFKGARRGIHSINLGMWMYEGLSLFRSPRRHRKLKRADVAREEPSLKTDRLKGAQLYYDCATDDARLTLESAIDAAQNGATIATWVKCASFLTDTNGRIVGAVARNQFTNELKEVRASVVVNATGPWTDSTIAMGSGPKTNYLRPTKGVHVVVSRDRLPVKNAVVCFHPEDRRVLFAIPWGERTYLGTTDTDFEGDPGHIYATLEDVDYLIEASNEYFPEHTVSHDDVISTWAGLRPLIGPNDNGDGDVDESKVSREHQIIVGSNGLITIAGGKLTTFRRMSAEVVDTVIKYLRLSGTLPEGLSASDTDTAPLPGAVNWPPDDDHARVAREIRAIAGEENLTMESAQLLANTYGMRGTKVARLVYASPDLGKPIIAGRAEIMAQIDFGVRHEMAATVTDILIQRTQIFYRALDQGWEAADRVAGRMAEILNWDEETRLRHVQQYRHDLDLSRRWRDELTPIGESE